MIPILYYGNETSFTTNGLGRLNDIIECTVTEERNGIYEVEFTYPITGKFYQEMVTMVEAYSIGNFAKSGIIACIHDDHHDIQPFDIYSVSVPIDGVATFNAHHISYRLGGMIIKPFEATSCADAFGQMPLKIVGTNPFTFWTDKATNGDFVLENIETVRSILGGEEGSFLDIFGSGEYEFDRFNVKLYQNRGSNTGITIRYGKNLMDLTRDVDASGHYNAIAPFWEGDVTYEGDDEPTHYLITLDETYVKTSDIPGSPVVAIIDFSQEFEDPPSKAMLKARALKYLNDNKPWLPDDTIKLSFVQLWQTTEYENVAILQRLSLCDQISVYYEELGVMAKEQEIIKVVYNVLLERYDKMELGKAETSLASSISAEAMATFEGELGKAKKEAITNSILQAAIAHATELITGGLGGHVVFNLNADGKPQEILIMDTDDPNTAMNVIRINQNGIGFSEKGYNGPFHTAWTIDGSFNAEYITSGFLNANYIKGGTLSLGGKDNGNGVMRVYDASGHELGIIDKNGFRFRCAGYYNTGGTGPFDDPHDDTSGYYWWGHYSRDVFLNDGGLVFTLYETDTDRLRDDTKYEFEPPRESPVGLIAAAPEGLYVLSMYRTGASNFMRELVLGVQPYYGGTGAIIPQRENDWGNIRIGSYPKDNSRNQYMSQVYPGNIRMSGDIVFGSGTKLMFPYNRLASGSFEISSVNGNSGVDRVTNFFANSYGSYITIHNPKNGDETYNDDQFQFRGYGDDGNASVFQCTQVSADNVYAGNIKSRIVKTEDYSNRLLYSYETPTPMFGDIGDGIIDENGEAYIFIDPMFAETVDTLFQYQVFLQKYGAGDCWVEERKPEYFLVKGTPNMKFGWELKAKQFDYSNRRLDLYNNPSEFDRDSYRRYGDDAAEYIEKLEGERVEIVENSN